MYHCKSGSGTILLNSPKRGGTSRKVQFLCWDSGLLTVVMGHSSSFELVFIFNFFDVSRYGIPIDNSSGQRGMSKLYLETSRKNNCTNYVQLRLRRLMSEIGYLIMPKGTELTGLSKLGLK